MLELGTRAPHFELPDVITGRTVTPESTAGGRGLLVMFICRHCPYVKHIEHELARIGRDYGDTEIGIVAISSNDAEAYPEDAPDQLKDMAESSGFSFPYCHDETQAVAKAYTAACTPDFFLFDKDLRLVYRGQLDDSRPGNDTPITGGDVRAALDALLLNANWPTDPDLPINNQKPSAGCNIKWQPGNEPDYFTS
jgi:peroxiredoxin